MSIGSGDPPLLLEPSNSLAIYQVAWTDSYDDILASPYLHRFTVLSGAKCKKEELLTVIMSLSPTEVLIPLKYKTDGDHSIFFMFECHQLVKELCSASLSLTLPHSKITVKFIISLKSSPLSDEPMTIDRAINNTLKKRTVKVKENVHLDLSNFHLDQNLSDIFFPLSDPGCASRCAVLMRKLSTQVHCVNLQGNHLTNLKILDGFTKRLLKVVDLRNNCLQWDALSSLQCIPLSEISLEGNPLCTKFSTAQAYLNSIKTLFPSLTKVDGHNLDNSSLGNVTFKNFFVNAGIASFADHFLHHYFKLYESNLRESLSDIYHPNAQLSVSTKPYEEGSYTFNNRFNEWILLANRNVMKLADVSKLSHKIKCGPDEIMDFLNKLPCVEFDTTSFTVDVPYIEDKKMVIINVTGVLREYPIPTIPVYFYFDRTFVLVPGNSVRGEWKILNDMIALTHPTQKQITNFKSDPRPPPDPEIAIFLADYSVPKTELVKLFQKYTELNQQHCHKFLSESKWDLEKAFHSFTDQLKANSIPQEAFEENTDLT